MKCRYQTYPDIKKSSFLIRKTTPRKALSRSVLKLLAADLAREFGPRYQAIDVRIGHQRMILDIVQGSWISEEINETISDPRNMIVLQERKHELEKDNSILRAKLDILLEMLAEVTAEEKLQKTSNK